MLNYDIFIDVHEYIIRIRQGGILIARLQWMAKGGNIITDLTHGQRLLFIQAKCQLWLLRGKYLELEFPIFSYFEPK